MTEKQTVSNCVTSLKRVRAQLHNDSDPSIAAELDRVIQQFEFCLKQEAPDPLVVQMARIEGLKAIALVIESVVSIADVVRRLWP